VPFVAVYGTLKVGEYNYDRWLAGLTPAFRGTVELPYEMFACDEYPMLVPSEKRHPVFLEVFEVTSDKLEELDALEGPYGYHRETTHVPGFAGALEVEVYVHPRPPPVGFAPVASGDWSER
jgi:gamma-glutamylcyclotransferase (GGCT)/AIG2-like uncharacterized protein YtfP